MAAEGSERIRFMLRGFNPHPAVPTTDTGDYSIPARSNVSMNFPLLKSLQPYEYDIAVESLHMDMSGMEWRDKTTGVPLTTATHLVVKVDDISVEGEWDAQAQFSYLTAVSFLPYATLPPPQSNPVIYQPYFYRRYAMRGTGPLQSMDVSFFIRYVDGSIRALPINPQCGWTIHFILLRRGPLTVAN